MIDVNIEDYPHIDPDHNDAPEMCFTIAVYLHLRDPRLIHFRFVRKGEAIGEVVLSSDMIPTLH